MGTAKKVLIVGAGPSGLACAEQFLENGGVDVTIVDKKSKVGENPRCAGGISFWMAEKVNVSIPEDCIVATIKKVHIYAPDGNYWELRGNRDYGCIVDRELFEQDMAKKVQVLGGKIELNHAVSNKDLDDWRDEYDFLVGADGFPSTVARWIDIEEPKAFDVHHCFQREIVWDWFPEDTIEVYFGSKVAPKGYLWLFAAGEKKVRAGLGAPLSECMNLPRLLDGFLEKQVYEYKTLNVVAKLIPTSGPRDINAFWNAKASRLRHILLVGDAGLFCDPLTGGGIIQGIASGKAAGRALAEDEPFNYDRYISWLRNQNKRRYRLKKVLYSFNDEDLNELIHAMKGFTPKTMSVGKEIRRAILHLLWRRPRLFKKFFKYLR